ncbi:S10 family serine carboxypeptidase-like protein [Phyllobacterium bourgognense]|uniref:S10 family serine carboxypeptidase-like protein n=1 Tax=Phyllobacterium bourgognense TaxID=314236 RepID=UPI001AEC92DB|nr:hypothetical protein [Phyllobacterium bourgognense]
MFSYGAGDSIYYRYVDQTPTSKTQVITVKGVAMEFTATAGHLVASRPVNGAGSRDDAAIFYTAYARDDLPKDTRPITFIFNGGPGGASADLDLNFLGPKSVDLDVLTSASTTLPLIDNPNTLLDKSDLVFVDPVGTGYSSAIFPSENVDFWGVDSDASILSDFVIKYINTNKRQYSPKYIYGVSYGGFRTPIMARLLLERSATDYAEGKDGKNILNGLVLNSPLMNRRNDCLTHSTFACDGAVPTYAMIADHHGKATARNAATSDVFLIGVRSFAAEFKKHYDGAFSGLGWGDRTGWEAFLRDNKEAPPFLDRLYQLTGLGKVFTLGDTAANNPWIENPNMNAWRFTALFGERYGPDRRKLSLNDGRDYLPPDTIDPAVDDGSDVYEYVRQYQRQFIGYQQAASYLGFNGESFDRWSYSPDQKLPSDPDRIENSIPDLAFGLQLNPQLKVLIQHGYYDLNTPFHKSELDISRSGIAAKVPVRLYSGGHGVSPFDTDGYDQLKAELGSFYDQTPAAKLARWQEAKLAEPGQ